MPNLSAQKRLTYGKHEIKNTTTLSEVFTTSAMDAGSIGFVLAHLKCDQSPLLWVQDRLSQKEAGHPYIAGMRPSPRIIRVSVSRPVDVLWAMEQGLYCTALSGVIGEVWGDPPALSFTASKRLALRAEANKTPCWLIRRAASPTLSAARDRWQVASLPSSFNPYDAQAPGAPRWKATLFRSRNTRTGEWVASYDRTTDRINFSAPFRDGALAENDGAVGQRTAL